ncbi:late control protein [Weeksella virosa]|uniref:late control protein n=1 Tax=Weeksella virosa TaxID=1014 RepID=UPI002552730C|nr:late control protein [Weeksella virosa]MDK7675107.1 late control protein [Weeksella virosa]
MFVLGADIKIGNFVFRSINEVEITKSVDEITDIATISLPTKFKVKSDQKELYTEEAIKVSDEVVITLAYDGVYEGVEFKGVVSKIKPTIPLEIQCEDYTWHLKRKNITKAWNKGVSLKDILTEVVAGTDLKLSSDIPDVHYDKYIIQNASAAKVLQTIKEENGLSVFLTDDHELYVGLQQLTNVDQVAVYDLNYNLVENNLEFIKAEDKRLKVRYTYIDKENKRKTIEVGDDDGELRTFHTSVISDENKLKELANAELLKLKYDGYSGSIESFLMPFATRGMAAKILDKEHPNRDGKYFVNKVVTKFGMSGARREIFITNKL